MSIPIPYGSGHSATVEGSVVKEVACEKCGHTYYYEHRAVGESRQHISLLFLDGEGARKGAEREARRTLRERLKSPMAVPCPRCGHYQRDMIPVARADRLVWLGGIGCVGLVIAGLAALCALPATAQALSANAFQVPDENTGTIAMWCWAVSVPLAGISLGILVIRAYLNERFNPNAKDVAARIRIGRELSLTRDQAEALLRGEPRDTGKGQQRYRTKAGGDGADIEPMKAAGISCEDNYRGNALAAMLSAGKAEVRYHKSFTDQQVGSIVRSLLACPELSFMQDWQFTYQGRSLSVS